MQVQLRKWIRNLHALERALPSAKCLTAARHSPIDDELTCGDSSSPPTSASSPTRVDEDDTKPFSLSPCIGAKASHTLVSSGVSARAGYQQFASRLAVHQLARRPTDQQVLHRWPSWTPALPLPGALPRLSLPPAPSSAFSSEELAAQELINMSFS